MSPLKVGDKVRTATALTASHWSENQLMLRIPDAEGVIAHCYPAGISPGCCVCAQHSCYEVQHDRGYTAYYHGDELTPVTQGAPAPDDEPDGGRLGEKVEALDIATTEAIKRIHAQLRGINERLGTTGKTGLSGQISVLWGRIAALEQPPTGEKVEALAAGVGQLEKQFREVRERLAAPGKDSVRNQISSLQNRVAALERPPAPEEAREAIAAARLWAEVYAGNRELCDKHIHDDCWVQLAPAVKAIPVLLRLATRAAPEPVDHSAAVDAADSWWCFELADALHVPVADGNELLHRLRARLDAYRALHRAVTSAKALVCWVSFDTRGALHVLEQLGVSPDSPPDPVHDDSSLDSPRPVAHCERCGDRPEQHRILTQMLEETTDTLKGIHQQLLEAVDGEPEATTEELLTRALRRVKAVQELITAQDPDELHTGATGLGLICSTNSIGWDLADLLDAVADIAEEEQD